MAINKETKYCYNDIAIVPSIVSEINHRNECCPFYNGMLPLFTAPMSSVVDENNFELFERNKINAILPRTAPLDARKFYSTNGKWAAYSLKEFSDVFCDEGNKLSTTHKLKVLIDVANGHMKIIFDLADKAKKIYGDDLLLMGGNIANPKIYEEYARHGFWGVRCGIGGGCFVGDTNITLSDNTKKYIKDVQVGDKVKTINGNYDVIGKKEEKTNTLVKINDSVTCTPNHKFLVINKDDREKVNENNIGEYSYYVEAKKLDKNKQLLVKML